MGFIRLFYLNIYLIFCKSNLRPIYFFDCMKVGNLIAFWGLRSGSLTLKTMCHMHRRYKPLTASKIGEFIRLTGGQGQPSDG